MTTFKQLAEGMEILAKYTPDGMDSNEIGADNWEIFFYVSRKLLDPNSDDGQRLQELGFHPHDGAKPNDGKNWAIFVL